MRYYIFILHEPPNEKSYYAFDRTVPSEKWAEERIQELKKQGYKAVWLKDHLIKGFFY